MFAELSEIGTLQHMISTLSIADNATQLLGNNVELLNDNTAFYSRFGGDIYQNEYQ